MSKSEATKSDPIKERIERILGHAVDVENVTATMLKPEDFKGGKILEFVNRYPTRAKDKDVFALTFRDIEKDLPVSMLETFQLAGLYAAEVLKPGVILYVAFKEKRQIAGGSKSVNEFDIRIAS